MKVTIFEGTPQEIAAVFPGLGSSGASAVVISEGAPPAQPVAEDASAGSSIKYVSLQLAKDVLMRRRLAPEQRLVLKTLYDQPTRMVSALELQKVLKYTRPQFSGLMGAFGRRLANTPGHASEWFFRQEWDYSSACYVYSLPETVREAMRQEGLV